MAWNWNMRKKWIYLLQLVVLILCIAGLFGRDKTWNMESTAFAPEQMEDGRLVFRSEAVPLRPGVYKASLSYITEDDMANAWDVEAAEGMSFDGLLANACMLYSGRTQTEMHFWLLEETDALRIKVICDASSQVTVLGAELMETNLGARAFLLIFLVCFILWDIVLFQREKRERRRGAENLPWEKEVERRGIVFGMVVLILVSSVPLLTGYEIASEGLNEYLYRLEGIKDAFLYIPAFLRIMGFPLGASYLIYKFLVNAGTVVIACESFGRIFKNRLIGLFAAALYTLNIYRLVVMYQKDHLGQYTAAMFLPLLVCGGWRLLSEKTGSKGYKNNWILLALGAAGIIQSQIPTCGMIAVFVLCLIGGGILLLGYKRGGRQNLWFYAGGTLIMLFLVTGLYFSWLLSESPFYKIYDAGAFGYRG